MSTKKNIFVPRRTGIPRRKQLLQVLEREKVKIEKQVEKLKEELKND